MKSINKKHLHLTKESLEKLTYACVFHNKGLISDDITIGTCWDADRLDLGRVGIYPSAELMSTEQAKKEEVLEMGYSRNIPYEKK